MRKLVDWYNHDLPCVFVDCLYCDFHCQHMTRQAEIMFKRMKTTKYTKMKHWGLNGAVKICVLELNLHRRLIVNGRSLSSRKELKAGVIQHSAMEQSAIQNQNVKCHVKSDSTHPIVYPDSSDSSASNSKSGDDKLEPRSLVRNNDNYFFKENSAYNDEDKNVVNEEGKEDKNNNAVNV